MKEQLKNEITPGAQEKANPREGNGFAFSKKKVNRTRKYETKFLYFQWVK